MGNLGPELWSECFSLDHQDKPFIIPRGPSIILLLREIWRDFLCLLIFEYSVAFSVTPHEPSSARQGLKHVQLRSGLSESLCLAPEITLGRCLSPLNMPRPGKGRASEGKILMLRTANDLCRSNSSGFADAACRVRTYSVWCME